MAKFNHQHWREQGGGMEDVEKKSGEKGKGNKLKGGRRKMRTVRVEEGEMKKEREEEQEKNVEEEKEQMGERGKKS